MQRLEVSCAVRPIYGSLGAKGLISLIAIKMSPQRLENKLRKEEKVKKAIKIEKK
jgi:hypothetical protein